MRTEESIKKQLELKIELYERINGTSKISESVLEGWINALRYVLDLPQIDIRKSEIKNVDVDKCDTIL